MKIVYGKFTGCLPAPVLRWLKERTTLKGQENRRRLQTVKFCKLCLITAVVPFHFLSRSRLEASYSHSRSLELWAAGFFIIVFLVVWATSLLVLLFLVLRSLSLMTFSIMWSVPSRYFFNELFVLEFAITVR